jgi:hypothetical protein
MLHMLQWLYTYVATVCFKCFTCVCCSRCFMLQVFSLAGAVRFMHFRCMFHLNVACVSSGCCKSRSGVAYVDLVPTACTSSIEAKRGAQQYAGARACMVPTCMHGHATWNEVVQHAIRLVTHAGWWAQQAWTSKQELAAPTLSEILY